MKNTSATYQFNIKSFKLDDLECPGRVRSNLAAVMLYAKANEWDCVAYYESTYHVIMRKRTKGYQMNIYLTNLTVQTIMQHPRKGKTQLNRKNIDLLTLEKLFKNIRMHTNKGYYTKS